MKRSPEDGPPVDPVLAQLDALINGTGRPPPAKAARTEVVVARDPVLERLDALVNPGASANASASAEPPPVHFATPVALVFPPPPQPALEPRGSPGLLREFGGAKAYMATLRADAEDATTGAGW